MEMSAFSSLASMDFSGLNFGGGDSNVGSVDYDGDGVLDMFPKSSTPFIGPIQQ